jgi:hypothetical protein
LHIPRSSKSYLPFSFTTQNFVCIFNLLHASYIPSQSHPPRFYDHNNIL